MEESILNKPLKSGKAQTGKAVGNPEPSTLLSEGATTIAKASRPKRAEVGATQTGKAEGNDIVWSAVKAAVVIRCKKCGKLKVLLDDFYGANRVCKECMKKRVSEYQRTEIGRKVHNKANRKWGKSLSGKKCKKAYKHTEKGRATERRYGRKLRRVSNKSQARALVNMYVRRGKLVKPYRCSRCGKVGPVEGHHADYNFPLQVEWLCRECHRIADAEVVSCIERNGGF